MTKGTNVVKISTPIVPLEDSAIPKLLLELLSRPTPHGTEERLLPFLPKDKSETVAGNVVYDVGNAPIKTIFSCHMDTVHMKHYGEEKIKLATNDKGLVVAYSKSKNGNDKSCVLGADDKIGMYIMIKMIEAKVAGRYIFHVGEEVGCVGSGDILRDHSELLKGIDRCIAFDRMGYTDIIDHQRSRRCCSTKFTVALATQLNILIGEKDVPSGNRFKGARGMYTDSATYMETIPECTNLSVGYFEQHTPSESFDLAYLTDILIPAVLQVDWEILPTVRDPKEVTTYPTYPVYGTQAHTMKYYAGTAFSPIISLRTLVDFPGVLPEDKALLAIKTAILREGVDEYSKAVLNMVQHCRGQTDIIEDANYELSQLTKMLSDLGWDGWYQ